MAQFNVQYVTEENYPVLSHSPIHEVLVDADSVEEATKKAMESQTGCVWLSTTPV